MTGATSRNRGNQYERDICRLLLLHGWDAITSRNHQQGRQAGADVITNLPVSVECKAQARLDLSGWLDQAIKDADDCPAAVFIKRRGRPTDKSYVVMRADQFLELVGKTTT
jgi:hypothetical protein